MKNKFSSPQDCQNRMLQVFHVTLLGRFLIIVTFSLIAQEKRGDACEAGVKKRTRSHLPVLFEALATSAQKNGIPYAPRFRAGFHAYQTTINGS